MELSTNGIIILVLGVALNFFLLFLIIKAALKSANSELVYQLKIISRIKGEENPTAFNAALREIQLQELEKRRPYLSADECRRKEALIRNAGN